MPIKQNTLSHLVFNFDVEAHFGWGEAERELKQLIAVEIKIKFAAEPKACLTDNLQETYCYDGLIKAIHHHIDQGEFRLLEHLTYIVYQIVKKTINNAGAVSVSISKKFPILNTIGSAVFFYGDEELT